MKKNKEIFSNIIGYDKEKISLKRVLDILNNQDKYKQLGSTIPKGILLYGPPGTGKTSISKELLNNINRRKFIIRKNKPDGEFINYLSQVFKGAIENEPSIILLDDLDKFAEDDNSKNYEEFVVVQSLIDEIKEKDIFIIATVNNIGVLPDSLLRSGRFDIKLKIGKPNNEDSFKIIEYYLKNKKISNDVNINNISHILNNSSCAELETVCNKAGIYAGYKNENEIHMEDLIKSSLEYIYDTTIENINDEDEFTINVAYHEAGHALIGELLEPNSVEFITTIKTDSSTRGTTHYYSNDNYWFNIDFMKNRIKTLLAGKAATEIVFNTCDTGSHSDLCRAYDVARRFVNDYCMFGFNSWYNNHSIMSEKIKQNIDERTSELLTKYYQEVKELLIQNRHALDALANELASKKIIFQDEIKEILKMKV